jgi:pyruvate/2-oxoacid:ferredoxin oxidoreductase alpha subunit
MAAKTVLGDVYESEELLTGTDAVAHAVRLGDVDVFSAYPIRPYTGVMDRLAKFIADGKFYSEYMIADGEHSQFEIAKHASSVDARTFAGSSGTGWLYATEALAATATDRLLVVALVGNRALDDPGALGVEHNDAMLAVGHPNCKYVATACATFPPMHYMNKVKRALTIGGPTFIHSLDPCPKGGGFPSPLLRKPRTTSHQERNLPDL